MASLRDETDGEKGCFSHCGDGDESLAPQKAKRRKRTRVAPHENDDDNAVLAKELDALSVQERNLIAKEICGVADEREESPEFIASCLENMNACLAAIPHAKRKDLDRAMFLKPSLERDDKFKLAFLRRDDYDPQKAAERLANYFAFKRDLFGEDKLVTKITLDDLSEEDLEFARAGGEALLLPTRDRGGRPIFFINAAKTTLHNHRNLNRYRFYNVMALLDIEAAQKKGIVILIYCPGRDFLSGRLPTPSEALTFFQNAALVENNLPLRVSSLHYCYDNPLTKFFIGIIQAGMGRDVRLRMSAHFGSATEIRYFLRSFGILTDGIVVAPDEVDERPKHWQHYNESRRELEQREQEEISAEESKTGILATANRNDVLLGRGRSFQEFPGNERFRALISANMHRYKTSEHFFEKATILKELIKEVHDSGGQFLRRTDTGWEVVDDQIAKEKIRKFFRSKPRELPPLPGDGAA